jgi:hypothetical protein
VSSLPLRLFAIALASASPVAACTHDGGETLNAGDSVIPAALIAQSKQFDRQPVAVTGTVAHLTATVGKNGRSFRQYELCSGESSERWCVTVLDYRNVPVRAGERATAAGIYRDEMAVEGFKRSNVVIVQR